MGQVHTLFQNVHIFNADFMAGTGCMVALYFSYQVYTFLKVPSIKHMLEIATKPIKQIGDNTKITVWGFSLKNDDEICGYGITDKSMYVMRIETYLLLNNQKDYIKMKTTDLSENPRGKFPMANINGTMVDDSCRILKVLQKHYQDTIDTKLTHVQKTQAILIDRLCTGSLYWVLFYHSFGTECGRNELQKELKRDLPTFMVQLLMPMIIRSQMDLLNGFGITKYPINEIIERGKTDLIVLNTLLGENNTYFFGLNEPTIYDTNVYSFVSHIFFNPKLMNLDWLQDVRKEISSLEKHSLRMRSLLFPNTVDSKKDQ